MAEPEQFTLYECEWPIDAACFTDKWDSYAPDVQHRSLALAISSLRRLTAYQVGGCPITVRPCNPTAYATFTPNDWVQPYSRGPRINTSGQWVNCGYVCGFATATAVRLPGPVGEVYEVKIDGDVINPTTYRLEGSLLIRNSGTWPISQNLNLPDTEDGTFSVRYLNSYPVDDVGAYACAILAAEFAKACTSDSSCRLPSTVTNVTRPGVSFNITRGLFPDGITGIREVDVFTKTWNPNGLMQAPGVYSPDIGW